MAKNIYILGLCYSHDASVCLLKNGVPVVAIQKERLTRIKHDGSIFDINLDECIEYCLRSEKIDLGDINLVVENSPTILYCREKDKVLSFKRKRLLNKIDQNKIIQISHHLAHAYCAYALSEFDSCSVLVIDGQGNYLEDLTEDISNAIIFPKKVEPSFIERESFYEFKKNKCRVIRKNFSIIHKSFVKICGLGHMYEIVSSYVFKSRHDAGKLMALAPFGRKTNNFGITRIKKNAEIEYFNNWVVNYNHPNRAQNDLKKYWDEYAVLARKTQESLEKGILASVKWFKQNSSNASLCYAGGVALNCMANSIILKKGGFKNLFITPAASDCGVSLGCALYGYIKVLGKPKVKIEYLDYLGTKYQEKEILIALKKNQSKIKYYKSNNIFKETAKQLNRGRVVGWWQDRSEFGPRALGNRSILADPRDRQMRAKLNSKVKFREFFRPFAPSVLEDESLKYFDLASSPYMLLAAKVKKDKRREIPAVVHVDNTARIQTVNKEQNYKYYSLISEFKKITGIPMLLNTSFNKNEPIVETPEDAIKCFLSTKIEVLVMGDYIATKKYAK